MPIRNENQYNAIPKQSESNTSNYKPDCRHFLKGNCNVGAFCTLSHRGKTEECRFYKRGKCTRGNQCTYSHKFYDNLCWFIKKHGRCNNSNCRYSHTLNCEECNEYKQGNCHFGNICDKYHRDDEIPFQKKNEQMKHQQGYQWIRGDKPWPAPNSTIPQNHITNHLGPSINHYQTNLQRPESSYNQTYNPVINGNTRWIPAHERNKAQNIVTNNLNERSIHNQIDQPLSSVVQNQINQVAGETQERKHKSD